MSKAFMSAEARAGRAEYYRRWRKEHPEKTREYVSRYWERRLKRQQNTNEAPNGETETGNGD